jgi:hypothetical protein
MAEETRTFLDHVLWQGDRKLSTLLSATFSFVNPALATHYGVKGVTGTAFVKTELPAGQRAGLLTQGSMMASLSAHAATDAVHRGAFIREELLCQPVPPPPANVNAQPVIPDGVSTERERLAAHRKDPACAACHELIDPIGLAFETYDPVGTFRTVEAKRTIDTTGTIRGTGGADMTVRNGVDLAQQLGRHAVAEACFVRRLMAYALATPKAGVADCAVNPVVDAFRKSGGDILGAAADIAATAFLTRAAN